MELLIIVIIIAAAVCGEQLLYSKCGGKKVSYSCGFSEECINEGQETDLEEAVENRKLLPVPWLKSELTIPVEIVPTGGSSTEAGQDRFITGFFMVRSYSGIKRVRRVKAQKRGVYRITAARVQTADLLGGIRISLSAEGTGNTLTVLPVGAGQGQVLPVKLRQRTGEQLVRRSLVTDPFFTAGVRQYMYGDPMKSIHWKASSHTGELMVRQEERTARKCLFILLNVQTDSDSAGIKTSDTELAEHTIRVCVSAMEEALGEGYSFILCSNGFTPEGQPLQLSERTDMESALTALAELSVKEYMPAKQFVKSYGSGTPNMTLLLITPYTDKSILSWKQQTYDSTVIVTGKGRDYEGIGDALAEVPERSEK